MFDGRAREVRVGKLVKVLKYKNKYFNLVKVIRVQ